MLTETVSHYRIVERIGVGGMGVVYKALDLNLGRAVALKVLPDHLARDPESMDRLRREARAASALNEPGICTIYEIGEANGTVFIAMELLEGETLGQRLKRGHLRFDEVLELALEICAALEAAHAKGVVHRDITPANIYLTTAGRVKVLDFGLAKLDARAGAVSAPTLHEQTMLVSMAGQLVGTLGYMSPEQAKGQPVDGRSDIFSLGLVLHEALTGRPTFSGSAAEVLSGILTTRPAALTAVVPGVTPEVDRVLAKALEKDRELRYQSATEWRADLKRFKRDAAASQPDGDARAPRRLLSSSALAFIAVILVAAAGGAFWVASSFWRTPPASPLLDATFTQLTDLPGLETFPSLSSDGQSLVFASAHEGRWHIYSQRVGGRNMVNLTADSRSDDTQPVLSPDGGRIAFRSSRDAGGIFIMGATGESVRRLTDFGYNPAWSADGSSIAVATELVEAPTSRMSYSAVWAVDVATGARRLVTDDNAVQPSWSPHNARLAYWKVDQSGNRDIYTVPVAGGTPVAVTNDAATDWSPAWSPDGRYLFFSSDRGGSMNLWRIRIDEQSGRTLGPPEPVTTPSLNSGLLSVSRDGSRIVYVAQSIARNVSRVALDPQTERVREPVAAVTRGTRYLRFPSVSPDGRSIAYTSDEKLMVSMADGSGPRQLTDGVYRDRAPRWSPDGSTLLFYSNRTGTYEIWNVRPDGSGLHQVTFGGPSVTFFFPVWSPDGSRFAFGDLKNKAAFLSDPSKPWADQRAEMLPPSPKPGTFFSPWSWSAAGLAGWAFGDDGQSAGLLVYDPAARSYHPIASLGSRPAWLPDAKRLMAFDHGSLVIVDVASGNSRKLQLPAAPDDEFSLSPDGSTIYFMQSERQGDVWLITLGGRAALK